MLEAQGLFGHKGSIVDASFVDVQCQHNKRDQNKSIKKGESSIEFGSDTDKGRQKDCDASGLRRTKIPASATRTIRRWMPRVS